MEKLIQQALAGNSDSLQAVAAIVSILAIVPAAAIFIVSQYYNIVNARKSAHQNVMDLYRQFLLIDLQNPKLDLGYTTARSRSKFGKDDENRLNASFEFLTSVLEAAFLTYSKSMLSDRRSQWRGWEQYIRYYASRKDYREWWADMCFDGNDDWAAIHSMSLRKEDVSQYDVRFEAFMIAIFAETVEA